MRRGITIVLALGLLACRSRTVSPPPPPPPPYVPPADAGAPVELDASTGEAPLVLGDDVPPMSGGTMVVLSNGLVVAGDELTDQLFVLDPAAWTLLGAIDLGRGAMPGRAVEDADGFVQVIMRRSGELLRVDPSTRSIVARRRICRAPRGLAWDESKNLVHVACADGVLASFEPETGLVVRTIRLEPDLRDVVVLGDRLYVSLFRCAELLAIDESGAIVGRGRPLAESFPIIDPPIETQPHVAWRLIANGDRLVMVHQRMISSDLAAITRPGGSGSTYYVPGGTSGSTLRPTAIADSVATTFDRDAQPLETVLLPGQFAVDAEPSTALGPIAAFASRDEMAVHRESEGTTLTFVQDPLVLFRRFFPDTRESDVIARPQPLVMNPGREAFHRVTFAGIACASCHPEGHEDGHVWVAADTGTRRSQSLLGGLAGTEPFHWNGDLPSFDHLMGAQELRLLTEFSETERASMLAWLDVQPSIPGRDASDRTAFDAAGCATCHAGALFSDEDNHDVGAGSFQTPRLTGVLYRAPYFFDGCATTLEATLDGSCRAVEAHGVVSPSDRAAVVAYLESL